MKPDSDAMPSPIMTVRELAQYLRVHQGTLYKLIRRGQIPVFKIGSDYRFDRDTIKTWMADRTSKFQILRPKSGPTPNLEH